MPDLQVQDYLDTANALIDRGDYEGAMQVYLTATNTYPGCSEAWLMLGTICGELGNLGNAVEYIQRSIDLKPVDGNAHYSLGQVKNALGDTEAALACFEKAIACDPEDTLALCTLGEMYYRLGNLESSIASYESAMAIDNAPQESWAMLGYLHLQNGNFYKAEECYRAGIRANNEDIAAVTGWCLAITQIDRPEASDLLMKMLLDGNPSNPEIYFQLAMTNSILGRHQVALNCIDLALQAAPSTDKYVLGKAEILERKADLANCFDILKPYLQSKPVKPEAVLIFAKFSHIVGLTDECVQLLQTVLRDESIMEEIRSKSVSALDWVNSAEVKQWKSI